MMFGQQLNRLTIQATSKGSDQTAQQRLWSDCATSMPRLEWAFAGRTYMYHNVGNLISQLNYYILNKSENATFQLSIV